MLSAGIEFDPSDDVLRLVRTSYPSSDPHNLIRPGIVVLQDSQVT
jgi:hypothetical protein